MRDGPAPSPSRASVGTYATQRTPTKWGGRPTRDGLAPPPPRTSAGTYANRLTPYIVLYITTYVRRHGRHATLMRHGDIIIAKFMA